MEVEEPKPNSKFLLSVGLVMILVGALLVAEFALKFQPKLGGASSCGTPGASTTCIAMPNGAGNDQLNFNPKSVKVVLGTNNTILWQNEDVVGHTVVSKTVPSGAASFQSVTINPGASYTVTLTVPGTYDYYCSIHPGWMQASIMVLPAGGSTSSNSSSSSQG